MTLDVQFKIKQNPYYVEYLRENSYWYKILTRNPESFKQFEEKAKERFALRPTDKINKILDTMEMINAVVSSLK